ncbi:uncharacterized protein AMSG_03773 [Thecamonas trahens ATCC 50062]|uniref:HMA domain-containing protein n=1 Tax=Thecamonas trahens ATCC 50062 TaxID=461836 RepID=A0A0L0D4T6_THETB|nr:hypothetical protein AMSG_03773 [Thecamonas trahens ATCC 50062]KNC47339.1 hypothetical protein AMSG_03773 [Thecamonas trahens ATCC 50062]|eukprot:XP_013759677.1 hypothetical protein AMSG_03773 [Thecamonas trahens ATCC 50062]
MEMGGIVNQFRTLSAEPANREFMVHKQNCLPALVTFLHVDDASVVAAAMQTLFNLAQHPANIQPIKTWDGLVEAIAAWTTREGTTAPIIKLSGEIMVALGLAAPLSAGAAANAAADESDAESEYESDDDDDGPPELVENDGPPPLTPVAPSRLNSPANAKTASKAATKTAGRPAVPRSAAYTLSIEGLSHNNRSLIERKLLQLQGIISFTMNVAAKTAVVRTRGAPEDIVAALEAIGYHAAVLGDESQGLETVRIMSGGAVAGKENSMPAYASDEKFVASKFTVVNNSGDHTLAGRRRARERRERQQASKVNSLLSRVGSWLW